jgi:aldose 1-epimerase
MGSDTIVSIRRGDMVADVAPAAGGCVARWATVGGGSTFEWLRPANAADLARGDPLGMGSFPLVPFSNRIRDGRFRFGGRTIALPLNAPPERHALHGHGWRTAWQVTARTEDAVEIAYDHPADAWPFPYRARQRIRLVDRGLEMTIALENRGIAPMPAGIGHHPYFLRTPACRVTARVEQYWLNDAEVMPLERRAPSPGRDPRAGIRPATDDCDNCFVGWDGRAEITWPEWGASLVMEATAPLRFLVFYTPPGQDYFCVEPVSHETDAFNAAAAGRTDTGTIVLAPGETIEGTMRLSPRIGS